MPEAMPCEVRVRVSMRVSPGEAAGQLWSMTSILGVRSNASGHTLAACSDSPIPPS